MRFRNTRTSTINAKVPTFDEICKKAGFGDLKIYNKVGDLPLMRGAVYNYMYRKGVTTTEIAKQSNRSNASVWNALKRFEALTEWGDKTAVELRNKVYNTMEESLPIDSPKNDLWQLMRDEHGVLLLDSELDEVIRLAKRV
jgi:predicted DNA-binding protein YlxM (UPF0122 family)